MKLCIFDLDGTLIDSLYDLSDALNFGLEKSGLKTHEYEACKAFIGHGAEFLINSGIGESKECFDAVKKEFYGYYMSHCFDKTIIYDGIKELLVQLKKDNFVLAVATNKPHDIACKIADELFPNMFDKVIGGGSDYPKKPDAYMIDTIRGELGAKREETLYIGDSEVDILTGANSGVYTVGVTWGFRDKQVLLEHGCVDVVDTAKELFELINK